MEVGLVDPPREEQPRVKGHFQVIIFSKDLLFLMFKHLGKDKVLMSTTSLLKSSFVNQKLVAETLWRAVVSYGGSQRLKLGEVGCKFILHYSRVPQNTKRGFFSALISIWAAET